MFANQFADPQPPLTPVLAPRFRLASAKKPPVSGLGSLPCCCGNVNAGFIRGVHTFSTTMGASPGLSRIFLRRGVIPKTRAFTSGARNLAWTISTWP